MSFFIYTTVSSVGNRICLYITIGVLIYVKNHLFLADLPRLTGLFLMNSVVSFEETRLLESFPVYERT